MKKINSIGSVIWFWMLLIGLVPLLLGGVFIKSYTQNKIYEESYSNLALVYRQAIEKINDGIRYNLTILENTTQIPLIAKELEKATKGVTSITPDPLISKHIERIVTKHRYYDFFIISKEGQVVYTYKKESDFGKNLYGEELSSSPLAQAFFEASFTLETTMTDIGYHKPSSEYGAFAVTPIVAGSKLLGFVGVQYSKEFVFELLRSESGLGRSGEVVAGRRGKGNAIFAAIPLKYDKKAFDNKRILNNANYATGMIQAIEGKRGHGEIIDYRGVKTLAVWGYEPNMGWGIVVKIDKDEAFEELRAQFWQNLFMFAFSLLLISILAFFISRRVTSPVKELVASMDRFKIDFHHRARVSGQDEIGLLATSFNEMADNIGGQVEMLHSQAALLEEQAAEIEEYSQNLEEMVEERTAQLVSAKKDIDRYVDIVDRFVLTSSTDKDGNITAVSSAFCSLTGYASDELLGKNHRILRDISTPSSLYEELWNTISSGQDWHGQMQNTRKDGTKFWVMSHISPLFDDRSQIVGYTAVREDITDKKKAEELAVTDQLTGLFNRRYLENELEKCADLHRRYTTPFSVIILDIDKFKSINDEFGHQVGDFVIKSIANILKNRVRDSDVVGRWGGEEFLVLLPHTSLSSAVIAAEHIRREIAGFVFDGIGHRTASFGVAQFEGDIDTMIKASDDALYEAKEGGRNRVVSSNQNGGNI